MKKIILTGGGTMGSVTPLLAIYDNLKSDDTLDFVFVGTCNGIEKEIVRKLDLKYFSISSGKLRRYFSWQNFVDTVKIANAFFESLILLIKQKPDIIISAGSFVSVPLVWAGWLLHIPILIHQMDIRPGLANKLMAPCASKITTVFEKSVADYGDKAEWTGNPIKLQTTNHKLRIEDSYKKFGLKDGLPTILIIGGGTGAVGLNNLVASSLDELTKICQVVHLTGKGKFDNNYNNKNYHSFEYISHNDLFTLLPTIDLVISRAGIGTLTELAYFKKPVIIIPMPDSHQEDNANYFLEKSASIVLHQNKIKVEEFVSEIKNILENKELQKKLSKNISEIIKEKTNKRMTEIITKLIK